MRKQGFTVALDGKQRKEIEGVLRQGMSIADGIREAINYWLTAQKSKLGKERK